MMQFSTTFVAAFLLAISSKALAADSTDVEGTSSGVEFPFSDDAIIEAVALGDDIAPIVLEDAVYFVNTTIVGEEYTASSYAKRSAEADAEADAWKWKTYKSGQAWYKRSAEADADADAWRWPVYKSGQAWYKRSADADADADAWKWKIYKSGQAWY